MNTPGIGHRVNRPGIVQAGDKITNSTTETAFSTQWTSPPKFYSAGRTVKVETNALVTTPALGTLGTFTLKFYLGTKVIATASGLGLNLGLSNSQFICKLTLAVIVGGNAASSQLEVQGEGRVIQNGGAILGFSLSNAATVTGVDLTVPQTLKATVQWTVALGTAFIQLRMLDIQATTQEM